jgi:hypothetical protein
VKIQAEAHRLKECRTAGVSWKAWGPYLSERQWGTVREDYSRDGNAWNYFTHDQARSRAYRWGEDGIAGISDEQQFLCFAVALWNGHDPILKERLFGLSNNEGNHGEDVKEYYFYLDNTPTHSYMKYLYKYPQSAFPYNDLVATNRRRSRSEFEYELLDTGVFDDNRYFDVFIEYAKNSPEDILIQISACNRGPERADLHIVPTLWFRNTWAAHPDDPKPATSELASGAAHRVVTAFHPSLGDWFLYCEEDVELLFTENDTNTQRIFGTPNASPYVKDGINNYIVSGNRAAVNPERKGTKAAAHHFVTVDAGKSATVWLRLTRSAPPALAEPFDRSFASIIETRRREADEFYRSITPEDISEDKARIMRQALAGMLWTKQYFGLDVEQWLREHDGNAVRNREWFHMLNRHILSMPDKWEYPWYAAWDSAFHAIALSTVDVEFAKEQLDLLLQNSFLHPSGQIPAYEWNFSDVNPPVHAWATIFLYRMERSLHGKGDLDFLNRSFHKLLLNFSWWVNRKDRFGHNVFEGGFLGLDNIGVFDRSAEVPGGGHLEQADGTAWVALFCQNMLEIAVELAAHDATYVDIVEKFYYHFLWIARGMNRAESHGMWDEEDGFYYDVLVLPDGRRERLKVRSMVGLLPVCATTIVEPWQRDCVPGVVAKVWKQLERRPDILENIHPTGPRHLGVNGRGIAALVNPGRLRRILARMLDENEFLSPYGIRSLSRYHLDHPYVFTSQGQEYRVHYVPAESDSGMFGGNSNWRGPVWAPVNALLIRALLSFYLYYGDDFRVECPTGSGVQMTLFEVACEIAERLTRIFQRDSSGRRPVYGGSRKFQEDPYWRDHLLFYEYFHGDNGAGLGASHQTGWTGLVASMIDILGRLDAGSLLATGRLREDRRPAQAAGVLTPG